MAIRTILLACASTKSKLLAHPGQLLLRLDAIVESDLAALLRHSTLCSLYTLANALCLQVRALLGTDQGAVVRNRGVWCVVRNL